MTGAGGVQAPVTAPKDSLMISDMKASRQRPMRSTRELTYKPGDDTADLSWSEATHLLNGTRLLTERHPLAVPLNFKGELRLPQAVILEAAMALEASRHIAINGGARAEVSMGRICGPPSLGKTVVSCALISSTLDLPLEPNLHMVPVMSELQGRSESNSISAVKLYNDYRTSSKGYIPELSIRYSVFFNITVVVAAANVLTQWEENIAKFTDLRYMTIDGVAALKKFAKALPNRSAAAPQLCFDVLLVKAGTVTTSFQFPDKKPPSQQSLLNTVRYCLGDVLIRRLIIDDHDMIPLKSDDYFIPARFTWIVSATQRRTSINVHYENAANVEDYIRNMNVDRFPILAAAHNDQLNVVVSLKCSQGFVDEYINSTQIVFRQVFVKGGGRAAGILQDLDVPVEVLDMIAADAIGAAAERLNLNISSIGEVIQRVLGEQKSKYHSALLTIIAMESVIPLVKSPTKPAVYTPPEKRSPLAAGDIAHDRVAEFREAARQGNKEECTRLALLIVEDRGVNMHTIVSDIKTRAETMRDRTGASLERMRSNIREGECRCCTLPFESGGAVYILANCCQAVVCENCICDDRKGVKKFIDRCTNCSAPTSHKDIIRVGEEIDLQESLKEADPTSLLLAATVPDQLPGESAAEPEPVDNIYADIPAYAMPKLSALVALIQGGDIPSLRNVRTVPFIKNLLSGVNNKAWPADVPKKILIFTMYTETTTMIATVLGRLKVPYSVLQGTRMQKDSAVEFVRETWEGEPVKVILVTSANNCAGLNMPFLSHVIFYHHVADSCIEAQVAGRGQRLGREHNLEVVKLLNEGEARMNEVEVLN